jgi:hypothetical protein
MPRKEKKYHFIYKTTNLLSGKYYIGMHSTDNLDDGYLGSGKRLRYSINKHGAENHVREILEFVDSREELKKREKEIVDLNEIAKDNCMNLMVGGKGGFISEEQQRRRSLAANKALNDRFKKDLEFYEKWKKNMSSGVQKAMDEGRMKTWGDNCNWSGKKHSEETKIKMSKSKIGTGLGENNSQFGTCWITKNGINKKIKKEELNAYLQQGWIKGRKIK